LNASLQTRQKSAAVISLHYTYAHASHMIALAKSLRDLGFEVIFVLDKQYISLFRFSLFGDVVSASHFRNNSARPIDIAIFCNSAVENNTLSRSLRAGSTNIIYMFHEPESIWNWQVLKTEGAMKMLRFLFSTYYSIKTLRQTSAVIVHSLCGLSLYKNNYSHFNRNVYVMPLLFDDEVGVEHFEQMRYRKQCFGFVGTACKAHGFNVFVEFAKFALRNGSDIPFVIATWVDLSPLLRSDKQLAGFIKQKKIRMQHGRGLSNDEINQYYLECFCTWNVYRRSTQSGVLARSYMAGTPVLASRVGSFSEDVRPGFTGEFVDVNEDPAAILATVQHLRAHATDYVDECRKRFMQKYYYQANCNQLAEIIKSTSINTTST